MKITWGMQYICVHQDEMYYYIVERPDNMSEEVWELLAPTLRGIIEQQIDSNVHLRAALERVVKP